MDLKTLIKEAHETAVLKGWYNPTPTIEETINNIHGEISEVWEEYRNNRGLNEIYWQCKHLFGSESFCKSYKNGMCIAKFCEHRKPCGIPIELADVVIRICDTLANYEVTKYVLANVLTKKTIPTLANKNFCQLITECHNYTTTIYNYKDSIWSIPYMFGLIREVEEYCQENQIDLEKAIALKMAYNKTRSYRHNGKKA